ncbi:MAG: CcmD family protein [Bacteroidota bacterium]
MNIFEFLNANSIYIVLFIVLVVWAGIYFYLVRLDRRIKRAEELIKKELHHREK